MAVADGLAVGFAVALPLGAGVGEGAGVGVAEPFLTFTFMAAVAINPLLSLYPLTVMVCSPFATLAEFQEKVNGGEDATQVPST